MGIKALLDTLDGVDEGIAKLYTKTDDGKFKLEVEGIEDASRAMGALQKERELKREAENRLRELQKQFEGIDPIKAKDLLSRVNESEEARLIAEGKLDEVIKSRTERMKSEYEGKLTEATTKLTAAEQRAAKRDAQVLENQVRQFAMDAKVLPSAMADALLRANTTFSLSSSDEAVAIGPDGQPVYGKDGSTPLSLKEWFESMKTVAPHWFPPNGNGSGAGNNATSSNGAPKRLADCKTNEEKIAWAKANSTKS